MQVSRGIQSQSAFEEARRTFLQNVEIYRQISQAFRAQASSAKEHVDQAMILYKNAFRITNEEER